MLPYQYTIFFAKKEEDFAQSCRRENAMTAAKAFAETFRAKKTAPVSLVFAEASRTVKTATVPEFFTEVFRAEEPAAAAQKSFTESFHAAMQKTTPSAFTPLRPLQKKSRFLISYMLL